MHNFFTEGVKMRKIAMIMLLILVSLIIFLGCSQVRYSCYPSSLEMQQRDAWINKYFKPVRKVAKPKVKKKAESPQIGLKVLANHDAVQKNSRGGVPLKLGKTEYTRGLYCHAVSEILVQLPSPAKTFNAVIGVDNNSTTAAGGSVIFSINVGDEQLYKSETMLGGGRVGVPISVDLSGANKFKLNISDAGDGIGSDQGDWADAKVVMADGREIWLDELPVISDTLLPLQDRLNDKPPFSFVYNKTSSDRLLGSWKFQQKIKKLDANRIQQSQSYTDPRTGLQIRCVSVKYKDYPTLEWTLYFKNTGDTDTPILQNIQALDLQLQSQLAKEFLIHHFRGSLCSPLDYEPFETILKPNMKKRIATTDGKPTNSDLSYFNLEIDDGGLIVVVGWPGQWAANFISDKEKNLRIVVGQELTHFKLHPGEEVRSPLIVLQFYKGDWIRAQNVWRRWMWAHNVPRPSGKMLRPQMAACSSYQYGEMVRANEENQKMFIDGYLDKGLKLDYWWMDAGWYVGAVENNWIFTGTWEVDTTRFPNKLRAISDHAHSKGVRTIVWFEPERIHAGTWLATERPEWVHGGKNGGLLKLDKPEVLDWLTNHVDRLINEEGIDLYRQDFNISPLDYWRANDADDRQGITEIQHATNYLAYWDELIRRHPNMLIDSCAGGGRRNDLETLRRGVPLLRSDYQNEPTGQQNHTYGISFWMPFWGSAFKLFDTYGLRSCMFPHITGCYDMRDNNQDYTLVKRMYKQWHDDVAPNFWGDYYPLTPYSSSNNVWMAWQFDRPEQGQGMVQAFRRPDNDQQSKQFKLRGLDPTAVYTVTDLDVNQPQKIIGIKLINQGLTVNIKDKPGSAIITYSSF